MFPRNGNFGDQASVPRKARMLENENDQSVTAHPAYTKSLEISCAAFLGNDDEN
jgi:hypothetical protein